MVASCCGSHRFSSLVSDSWGSGLLMLTATCRFDNPIQTQDLKQTLMCGFLCVLVESLPTPVPSISTRATDVEIADQTKRDLSLSYSATDINSKEGTRVKTITVIKNIGNQNKHQPLAINPELHKDEEWANAFRDNFSAYGKIPDVPDIDDLFKFVKKSPHGEEKALETPTPKSEEIPAQEHPSGEESPTVDEESTVEKIKGDVELIPSNSSKNLRTMPKSESLPMQKYRVHEPDDGVNHSVIDFPSNQHFDKYVQLNSNVYDNGKPCDHATSGTVMVKTSSGRSYDIPVNKHSNGEKPYIAPSISKKTRPPLESNQQSVDSVNQQQYTRNSLLPPLPLQGGPNSYSLPTYTAPQQPQTLGYSSTLRAYVAPSLRNGLITSRGPAAAKAYSRTQSGLHTNVLTVGSANRANYARSRGLKY